MSLLSEARNSMKMAIPIDPAFRAADRDDRPRGVKLGGMLYDIHNLCTQLQYVTGSSGVLFRKEWGLATSSGGTGGFWERLAEKVGLKHWRAGSSFYSFVTTPQQFKALLVELAAMVDEFEKEKEK